MMKYFGTDGIRGKHGVFPINGKFFKRLAGALETFFAEKLAKKSLTICIGRDTRKSGVALTKALCRGFSPFMKVLDCGILPTPAIAEMVVFERADFGLVITASHNPSKDNGVKIFNGKGEKLTVEEEEEVERIFDFTEDMGTQQPEIIDFHSDAKKYYCEKYFHFLPRSVLLGKTVVIDSANGATYEVANEIFKSLGANVIHIGNSPNGENINDDCGSEHTDNLVAAVKEFGAFIGIAYDGDGDRVVIFDEFGNRVDGDILIGAIATNMFQRSGSVSNGGIVVTIQSNLGLDKYCHSIGVDVVRCDVGDRNVYQMMVRCHCQFGGESSGHLIFRRFSAIGDGITASLHIISLIVEKGMSFADMREKISLFPQKSFNVSVNKKVPVSDIKNLNDDIEKLEAKMSSPRRIVARYSGTEPKLRILIEGKDQISVDDAWSNLKSSIIKRMCENGISASIS